MKISDDYLGKLELWIRKPDIGVLPKMSGLPRFTAKRFRSYEEMNKWKLEYLREIAENGGIKWTK
jgi:hypothetical protein